MFADCKQIYSFVSLNNLKRTRQPISKRPQRIMKEQVKNEYTLKDLLRAINLFDKDTDVEVDGSDCCIAVCPPVELSPAGLEHFAEALTLPVEGTCIMGRNDRDYDLQEDGDGALALAEELVVSLAGYCSCEAYEKWFEKDAKAI